MLIEGVAMLLAAGIFGVYGLSRGLRNWARPSTSSQVLGALAAYTLSGYVAWFLFATGVGSIDVTAQVGYSHALSHAGGVYAGWQYSTLLACVLPSIVFGFLFVTKLTGTTLRGLVGLGFMLSAGLVFVCTNVLLWWLVSFELLLLVSLYLLRLTSKSERIGEAVTEMFFWTLAGSICLLFAFLKLALTGYTTLDSLHQAGGLTPVVGFLFLIGFGVKLPLWPCFSWLLKAHVEASVEFSILLSGVVVKFGALGLYRTLVLQGNPLGAYLILACGTLAIVEAALRLLAQRDLKRVVALTTVIEMNWVGVCLGLGGGVFDEVGAFLLVAHSLTTTGEFFGVECLYRRYGSRDLSVISGVAYAAPFLYACLFLTTLVTIGFPATSLFAAKLLFLASVSQFSLGLCLMYTFWFVLVLPVIFLRIWVPVWFGQPRISAPLFDLTGREAAVLLSTLAGGFMLGVQPTLVLDCR